MKLKQENISRFSIAISNFSLWAIFILYAIVAGYAISHHEPWGDEIHSWNIAKASGSFADLISNTRYEGHPPVWYVILWGVTKFTHHPAAMQWVHFVIASLTIVLVLFYSPFPFFIKALLPFGYFFLFEYAVISRNYGIAVLIAFCLCVMLQKKSRYRNVPYYTYLFLLSNTHLLALLLAACFHLYYLLQLQEKRISKRAVHVFAGIIILLPSAFFIFPPSDSSLSTGYWLQRWEAGYLVILVQAPVKAFLPIPAWQEYHFWNTQFITSAQSSFPVLKWIAPLLAISLAVFAVSLLRKCKPSQLYFITFLLLSFLLSAIIPFSTMRHAGFLYIGFWAACWLCPYALPGNRFQKPVLIVLLGTQIAAALLAVIKDVKLPFSNGPYAKEMIKQVPPGKKIVTDYWCLNTLSAFTDTSYYCVDLQKEASYLLWNNEMKIALSKPDRYSAGIKDVFNHRATDKIYLISLHTAGKLMQLDQGLSHLFNIRLVDKKDDAIEKGSNLYLYEISRH